MKVNPTPVWLVAVALFLAPIIGGQIVTDAQPIEPGFLPVLNAVFGGAETPILSQALVAVFALGAAVWVLVRHRVVQLPKPLLHLILALFGALLLISVPLSEFKFPAAASMVQWGIALAGMWVVVATAGRSQGPKLLLGALFCGTVVVACLAVLEYGAMRSRDPSWRVFGTWVNPNALAAMLQTGLLAGMGAVLMAKGPWRLAGIACSAVVGLAILLTQSKGVFLTTAIGLFVFALILLFVRADRPVKKEAVVGLVAFVALAVILGFALKASAGSTAATPLARIGVAGEDTEQSAGFRSLLWKGAIKLSADRPAGYGLGSFRFVSAKPGLTTQTQLAHNSFLQLSVEGSLLSPILLLTFGAFWIWEVWKGFRSAPFESALLRSSTFCAVLALALHSMIDSDLHHFGMGFVFFCLLGIGLTMSPDGVAPEHTPKPVRWIGVVLAVSLVLWPIWFGIGRLRLSEAMGQGAMGFTEQARAKAQSASAWIPFDAEAKFLLAQLQPPSRQRTELFEEAVNLGPSTRHLRALAREQAATEQPQAALITLNRALQYDPNNLPTLELVRQIQLEMGGREAATDTAKRMLEVEETAYFQIRALPELVATETYSARLFLAGRAPASDQIRLLKPAVDGFESYRTRTVPKVFEAAQQGLSFGGETLDDVSSKMSEARDAAKMLEEAYRSVGEDSKASTVGGLRRAFDEVVAEVSGAR